ncbi:MAG TPA: glycosyl hydrolase family 8 [Terracidiphilus sp.]|nr:glycosyl hydrolase family 8 [Terracidiphilus sp.]
MIHRLSFALLSTTLATLVAVGQTAQPKMVPLDQRQVPLDDGHGAYATHRYRNLFAEAGHPQKEIDAKIEAAFQQFFHGDPETQAVYYPAGSNGNGPLAYLSDVFNHDVRTEGMSYGMMIAVQLNHKAEFDALWNWAKSYMYIGAPTHPSQGYFSWSCKVSGEPNDETPAPDGEEYFVMALYFAANRWGNGAGIYNYKAQADELLTAMRHRERRTGATKFGARTVAAEVNEDAKMIRFTPVEGKVDFTDPSYHLPAFYELWARWGPAADRAFWAQAAEVSRDFIARATNAKTGLCPEYANFDGMPHAIEWNQRAGTFAFDSWRTQSNWSVDWSWWAKDPRERALSDRVQAFFFSQGIGKYANQFTLDGQPLSNNHSTGLMATSAVASLAATQPVKDKFVEELWKEPIPSGNWRYYDGMLYFMSLLHVSGNFRIWGPQ